MTPGARTDARKAPAPLLCRHLPLNVAVNEQRASSRQIRRKHFGFQALALRADMLAFFRWKIPQLDIIDFWPIRAVRIQMPF